MKLRCYCLCQIMQIPTTQPDDVRDTASTPMKLGGLGWSRLPADDSATPPENCSFVCGPVERTTTHHVPQSSVRGSNPFGASRVRGTHVDALALDARPPPREPEDVCEAGLAAQCNFRSGKMCERRMVHARNRPSEGSRLTSPQGGKPRSRRVLAGGRLLDAFGHHRAACARTRVLCLDAEVSHWRVPLQEFAGRQGAECTNTFVRDYIPTTTLEDSRRLDVVVDGVPFHCTVARNWLHFTWRRTTKEGRR